MPSTNLFWRTIRPLEGFYESEVQGLRRLPMRTFLPTGYEPNYPYPLLVFFHGHGGSDEQILKLAPRLSRRNYVCIGLRGPQSIDQRPNGQAAYTWDPNGGCNTVIEDYIFRAIEQTRRNYHIHSERIYLAGFCEGATLAYRLGLSFPERFAGIIALNGTMPQACGPIFRYPQMRQLQVFIGHGIANAVVPLASAKKDFRALYTAGVDVRLHTYLATHRLHPDMLRDINRWIIDRCNAPE
jgi:phospholipase/carboxylesterase